MTITECAKYYQKFINCTCRLTLENDMVIVFQFKRHHFKHLLGLEKLTDIDIIQNSSANVIYKRLLSDDKLAAIIRKSHHYDLIENRLKYFDSLEEILHGKIIIDFEPSFVQDGTLLLNTDYILYLKKDGGYVNFTIGGGINGHYPETFFFEPSNKYITDQTLLDVVSVEIIPK